METILIFSKVITKIEQWIQSGGTLIAYQDAIKWLNDNKLIELVLKLASWRQRTFHSSNRETTRAHKKSQVQYLKLN
jgi:shikimate kinase